MRLSVSTVFLFSVLLLGMISYPSINFGDKITSDLNSSNYLISAFAEEDEDEKNSEDKIKNNEDETEDELDDETEDELDDETEDELDDEKDQEDGETEIEVEVKNDKAKVKIKLNDEEYRFVVNDDVSESAIIATIIDKTGLTEDEIRATWDFETEDETEDDEDSVKNELRLNEKIMKHENKAQENAEQIILQLQQKIDQLEQRLQDLLDKFETGEYFGTVTSADTMPDSYGISFNGLATSLDDDSIVSDVDGDIYLESITTGTDSFKLRITGGEILIGDTFYDFVFGKARLSSSDGNTSMIILGQVMDDQGNINTIRLTLDTATALTGEFGTAPVSFDIDSSRSKIAKQWGLDASGDFALLS